MSKTVSHFMEVQLGSIVEPCSQVVGVHKMPVYGCIEGTQRSFLGFRVADMADGTKTGPRPKPKMWGKPKTGLFLGKWSQKLENKTTT